MEEPVAGSSGRNWMESSGRIDYFGVDELLTEAERSFRDRVKKFVDEECMPKIADHFDKGTFPMDLIPRMAEMGLFGAPCGWIWMQEGKS